MSVVFGWRGMLAAVAAAAFFASEVQAAPERYREREREREHREWEVHRAGHIVHELPPGYRMFELHGIRYYERGGVYFKALPEGYVVVDAPDVAVVTTPAIGAVAATLPLGAVSVTIGGNVFYRHGNVFYRRHNDGYIVVEPPPSAVIVQSQPGPPPVQQVISSPPPAASSTAYTPVWVGDQEYLTQGGYFYRKAPDGLRQVDAPIGAVLIAPPTGAQDMWIGDAEYYYLHSTFYQKRPSGYALVPPPPNAYIKAMPKGTKSITTAGQQFFDYNGSFYQQRDQGFLISAPPIVLTAGTLTPGTVVAAPPDGAVDLWVNDIEYLYFGGNFYRKQPTGYLVVPNPL